MKLYELNIGNRTPFEQKVLATLDKIYTKRRDDFNPSDKEAVTQAVLARIKKNGESLDNVLAAAKDTIEKRMRKSGNYVDMMKIKEALRQAFTHALKENQEYDLFYKRYAINFDQDSDGFFWINYNPELPKELDLKFNKANNRSQAEIIAKRAVDAVLKEDMISEGYTLKKTSKEKFDIDSPSWDDEDYRDENDEDLDDSDYSDGPTKGWETKYEIIDNKTKKVVGTAELRGDNYFGNDKMRGKFLGKSFTLNDIKKDPQAAFNAFTKWPSTKKKLGKLMNEGLMKEIAAEIPKEWKNSSIYWSKKTDEGDLFLIVKHDGDQYNMMSMVNNKWVVVRKSFTDPEAYLKKAAVMGTTLLKGMSEKDVAELKAYLRGVVKESKFDPVEYLKGLHTKQLMNLRKAAHAHNGKTYIDYIQGSEVTIDQIKAELAKREHVPNKIETKAARQALAKAKKNR